MMQKKQRASKKRSQKSIRKAERYKRLLFQALQKQKVIDTLVAYLTKPIDLCPETEFIRLEVGVQIRELLPHVKRDNCMVLTCLIRNEDMDRTKTLCNQSSVTGSYNSRPMRRNVFTFIPYKRLKSDEDDFLKYGQGVYIRIYDSGAPDNFYLFCDICKENNKEFPLEIWNEPNLYSMFTIQHWDKRDRISYLNQRVPVGARVSITNPISGSYITLSGKNYKSELFSDEPIAICESRDYWITPQFQWTLH